VFFTGSFFTTYFRHLRADELMNVMNKQGVNSIMPSVKVQEATQPCSQKRGCEHKNRVRLAYERGE
jgi:hypothetical protein